MQRDIVQESVHLLDHVAVDRRVYVITTHNPTLKKLRENANYKQRPFFPEQRPKSNDGLRYAHVMYQLNFRICQETCNVCVLVISVYIIDMSLCYKQCRRSRFLKAQTWQ